MHLFEMYVQFHSLPEILPTLFTYKRPFFVLTCEEVVFKFTRLTEDLIASNAHHPSVHAMFIVLMLQNCR